MAQTDTAFWFAPPDLSNFAYTNYGETPVRLVFHSYGQPATVTVEQPANPYFPTTRIILHPYDVDTIGLSSWVDSIETKPVNTVLNWGFYIHSTAPITCYYQCTSTNRETYTLKGRNALGTEQEQNHHDNQYDFWNSDGHGLPAFFQKYNYFTEG